MRTPAGPRERDREVARRRRLKKARPRSTMNAPNSPARPRARPPRGCRAGRTDTAEERAGAHRAHYIEMGIIRKRATGFCGACGVVRTFRRLLDGAAGTAPVLGRVGPLVPAMALPAGAASAARGRRDAAADEGRGPGQHEPRARGRERRGHGDRPHQERAGVTNNHVIAGATTIRVTVRRPRTYIADVLGYDITTTSRC